MKRSSKVQLTPPPYLPDSDQAAYLKEATASYSIVIAGPGSGKTTTAIQKILSIEDERAGQDTRAVLFISFSKASISAAAGSMHHQLESLDLEFQAQTIDSLAYETCQLFSSEDVATIQSRSFESRLSLAKQLAEEWQEELTDDLIHVFIDEAQDISSEQTQFLASYLKYLPTDCGVTIFADPLQEIYKFLDNEQAAIENAAGYDASRLDRFLGALKHLGTWKRFDFSGRYRCTSPLTQKHFDRLRTVRALDDTSARVQFLDSIQGSLPRINAPRLSEIASRTNATAAVLTRTNTSVGFLFDRLVRKGLSNINPVLTREGREGLPGWVADAFTKFGPGEVDALRLLDYLEDIDHPNKAAFQTTSDYLSWGEISTRIRSSTHTLTSPRNGCLNLQTIHQAKGLEFDHVAILNPSELLRTDAPEIELLYVALTRPREMCYSLELDATVSEFHNKQGRLYRYGYRRGKRQLDAIMIFPSDVVVPPTLPGVPISEAPNAAFLEFERISFRSHATYRCSIDGTAVAETSAAFGELLKRECGDQLPDRIGNVPIASLSTEFRGAGEELTVALIPRPLGISDIH